MTDPIGIGASLVPVAGEQLAAFLNRNGVKNLLQLAAAEVARTPGVPPDKVALVRDRIRRLGVEPDVMGAFRAMLDRGDITVVPALAARLREILVFNDPALDQLDLGGIAAASFRDQLSAAKRDDRRAAHVDAQITRTIIAESTAQLRDEIPEAVRAGTEALLNQAFGSPMPMSGLTSFPRRVGKAVAKLTALNPGEAEMVRQALAAGGPQRIVELIGTPQPWADNGSADLWETFGQVATAHGAHGAAENAFLRAADHPGVADRVRQLVRASDAADNDDRPERARELLDEAENIAAQHPAVLLVRARLAEPSSVLELLADVAAPDDDLAEVIELTRASALAATGDDAGAQQALGQARNISPDSDGADEVEALVVLTKSQMQVASDSALDRDALKNAGDVFSRLATIVEAEQRPGPASTLRARAALAYALAEEKSLADLEFENGRALGKIDSPALLGQVALQLQRFDDVIAVVPDDEREEHRLLRANAQIFGNIGSDNSNALNELESLMGAADEATRDRAAFTRLAAASQNMAVPWSDQAEALVAIRHQHVVALLKAERLVAQGKLEDARAVPTPHTAHSTVLRAVVAYLVQDGRYADAIRMSAELVRRHGDPHDQLNHLALLAHEGEIDEARNQLMSMARDPSVPTDLRRVAYRNATGLASDSGDYDSVATVAAEWQDHFPEDGDAAWLRLWALARRMRHADAIEAWDAAPPDVLTVQQALLAAQIFTLGDDPVVATTRIAELTERFYRPEQLEFHLMVSAMRIPQERRRDMPRELLEQIRESFRTFPERFPDSSLIRAFKIDPDDPVGSFVRLLREQLAEQAPLIREQSAGIRTGSSATQVLASIANRSIGEVWFNLHVIPLGFSDEQLSQREGAYAAEAVEAGAAVWDSTALFVVGGLGKRGGILRNSLPASLIAQSTFDDATQDVARLAGEQSGIVGYDDAADQPFFEELSELDAERQRERVAGTAELARNFTVVGDQATDRGEPDDELRAVVRDHQLPTAARSWAATLVIARDRQLAVFSDDRYVRLSAHQVGIPAFGSLALMDALRERAILSDGDRTAMRRRLYSTGAWGLEPSAEEITEWVHVDDCEPTKGIVALLSDIAAWMNGRAELFARLLTLLDSIAQDRSEQLGLWVHRVIDALTQTLGGDYTRWARMLVFVAINPLREPPATSPAGLQAILDEIRALTWFRYFPPSTDLVMGALEDALRVFETGQERAFYFKKAIARLSQSDQETALRLFVS